MDKRTVAVVMPAYNTEKYIAPAIESVLGQTYEDIMLVIVDDASTDRTWSVIKKYTDPRIYAIKSEKNCGVSHARNVALQFIYENFLNKVGYVAFVDADDICRKDRIYKMIDVLPDGFSVVVDDYYELNDETGEISPPVFLSRKGLYAVSPLVFSSIEEAYKQNGVLLGTFHSLVPLSLIKDNNIFFNEKFSFAEDFHFLVDMMRAGAKLVFLPDAYYIYRIRRSSLAHSASSIEWIIPVLEDCLEEDHFKENDEQTLKVILDKAIKEKHSREVIFAVRQRRFFNACMIMLKHPSTFFILFHKVSRLLYYRFKYHLYTKMKERRKTVSNGC